MPSLRSSSRASTAKKDDPAKFVVVEFMQNSSIGPRSFFEVVCAEIIRGSCTVGSEVSYLPNSTTRRSNGVARKMRRGIVRGEFLSRAEAQSAFSQMRREKEATNQLEDERTTSASGNELLAALFSLKTEHNIAEDIQSTSTALQNMNSSDGYASTSTVMNTTVAIKSEPVDMQESSVSIMNGMKNIIGEFLSDKEGTTATELFESISTQENRRRKRKHSLQDSSFAAPPTLVNEGGDNEASTNYEEFDSNFLDGNIQLNENENFDGPDSLEMEEIPAVFSGDAINTIKKEIADEGSVESHLDSATPPPPLIPVVPIVMKQKSTALKKIVQKRQKEYAGSNGVIRAAEDLTNVKSRQQIPSKSSSTVIEGEREWQGIREMLSTVLDNQLLILRHLGRKSKNSRLQAAEQRTRDILAANEQFMMNSGIDNTKNSIYLRPIEVLSNGWNNRNDFTGSTANGSLQKLRKTNQSSNIAPGSSDAFVPTTSTINGVTPKLTLAQALKNVGMPLRVVTPKRRVEKSSQNVTPTVTISGSTTLRSITSSANNSKIATVNNGGGKISIGAVVSEKPRNSATASIASTTPICLLHFNNGMPVLKNSSSSELVEKSNEDEGNSSPNSTDHKLIKHDYTSPNIFSDLPPLERETF